MRRRDLRAACRRVWACAWIAAAAQGSSFGAAGGAVGAAAPSASEDLEVQYKAVLNAMKSPPATGVLVTQTGSAAAAGGIRGGDIIIEYHGAPVSNLRELRQQVADAVGRTLAQAAVGTDVLVRLRRQGAEVLVKVPREALGIRGLDVVRGVPVPGNPPPSLRGALKMNWEQVIATLAQNAGEVPMRTGEETHEATGDETWLGWQVWKVQGTAGNLVGSLEIARLQGDDDSPAQAQRSMQRFVLWTGDHATAPAFTLREFGWRFGGEGAPAELRATRVGEVAHVESGGLRRQVAMPLDALTRSAAVWVGAAMPQESDAVLGLRLISEGDLAVHPGYALVTRGRQRLPGIGGGAEGGDAGEAWRVDLLHCGVVVESYWYSNQRRVLCVRSSGAQGLISRRVPTLSEAMRPPEDFAPSPRPGGPPAAGRSARP